MKSEHALAGVVVATIFPFFASIAVALRFLAQRIKGNKVTVDMYLILTALIIAIGVAGMIIYGCVDGGLGWDLKDINAERAQIFRKLVFAGQFIYATVMTMIRFGLLLLYRRIFDIRRFRITTNILMVVNVCWWITFFFGTIGIYKFTETKQVGGGNFPIWLLSHAFISMLLDIITLALPMFVIRTLKINSRKKVYLGVIFGVGFFCIIASIMRVIYFIRLGSIPPEERSLSSITYFAYIWSYIEICSSIIASCLPACSPILKAYGNGFRSLIYGLRTAVSGRRNSKSSISEFPDERGSEYALGDGPSSSSHRSRAGSADVKDDAASQVKITTWFEVSSHKSRDSHYEANKNPPPPNMGW